MKKEIEMKDYGMFSDFGNQKVDAIVQFAFENRMEWPDVLPMLRNLANSDYDRLGEATDTAVREAVYESLLLTSDFYV
jgi:hypothetical protein